VSGDVLRGLGAIGDALGVRDPRTVRAYAERRRDPLPLVRWGRDVEIRRGRLDLWRRREAAKGRRRADPDLEAVSGLVVIAGVLRRSVGMVLRYAMRLHDPLPIEGLGTRRPWIWRSALEDWFERQAEPYQAARWERRDRG
jgi:hypothetical protein